MDICEFSSLCTNPASVEIVLNAPFSMTSSAQSTCRTIKICSDCEAQIARMESVSQR